MTSYLETTDELTDSDIFGFWNEDLNMLTRVTLLDVSLSVEWVRQRFNLPGIWPHHSLYSSCWKERMFFYLLCFLTSEKISNVSELHWSSHWYKKLLIFTLNGILMSYCTQLPTVAVVEVIFNIVLCHQMTKLRYFWYLSIHPSAAYFVPKWFPQDSFLLKPHHVTALVRLCTGIRLCLKAACAARSCLHSRR